MLAWFSSARHLIPFKEACGASSFETGREGWTYLKDNFLLLLVTTSPMTNNLLHDILTALSP